MSLGDHVLAAIFLLPTGRVVWSRLQSNADSATEKIEIRSDYKDRPSGPPIPSLLSGSQNVLLCYDYDLLPVD